MLNRAATEVPRNSGHPPTSVACHSCRRRVTTQGHPFPYIGADRTGRLLEVVVLDDDGQPVAIHAMALRPKFYEHL